MVENCGLTPGQLAMLDAVPEHGGAPVAAAQWGVPASEYIDPERFMLEKRRIFSKEPVVVGLSAQLPEPDSYLQTTMLGVPILLARAKDGVARAFVNVCKHRGALLCPEKGVQSGSLIRCPYHAWGYALDGRLAAVPRAEVFEDVRKPKLNLTPLPCLEAGGLIWAGLDHLQKVDFSRVSAIADDLDALRLGKTQVFKSTTYHVPANWKLILDTMLDGYHITRLHQKSLGRYFVDAPTLHDMVGPHLRSASGRGNFSKAGHTADLASVRRVVGFSYILFPNALVVVSPDYINVGVLHPKSYDATDVEYSLVAEIDGQADRTAFEEKLGRSFALMDVVFGNEDFWAAGLGQAGLEAGVVDELVLGGMEAQMKTFHDVINACLVD